MKKFIFSVEVVQRETTPKQKIYLQEKFGFLGFFIILGNACTALLKILTENYLKKNKTLSVKNSGLFCQHM